jgi:hypothetical protein
MFHENDFQSLKLIEIVFYLLIYYLFIFFI